MLTADHNRKKSSRHSRTRLREVTTNLPSTEALERDTGELLVIPGSVAYEHWLQLLREGKITYSEFIDWTTPGRFPTPRKRLAEFLRTLLAGFTGVVWHR